MQLSIFFDGEVTETGQDIPAEDKKENLCKACELSQQRPHSGVYHLTCLECCARAVKSARPSKAAQEGILAVIEMTRGAPKREEILEKLRGER